MGVCVYYKPSLIPIKIHNHWLYAHSQWLRDSSADGMSSSACRVCVCMCVCDRERESEREGACIHIHI